MMHIVSRHSSLLALSSGMLVASLIRVLLMMLIGVSCIIASAFIIAVLTTLIVPVPMIIVLLP